ncbi:DNA/RNA helicase, DEAD/DEAH box type, N-terminal [Cynara cardunculus var. scolymus]|uniref:ATP-dependent RNA helicase n=1 Tax=Cynara cardunculus var. scolymus TaxID=59895 RepID=A0A103XCP6_CYNCS|nr:DNA/RNA helicase, DEAD/DEAH box type, N-terminal [Cynara cardunculus var. scolymus]
MSYKFVQFIRVVATSNVGLYIRSIRSSFQVGFEEGTCFALANEMLFAAATGCQPTGKTFLHQRFMIVLKNHQQFSREESSFFCKGLDVIQQARSGTGKTATFCSGILQQLDYNVVECQALVLAPTRELAQQIEKVMRALGDYLGVKVHACVGGTSIREDLRILSAGVHVVVGTPGRVFDMLRRQSLRAYYIKMFVLDEAHEMLSRGFKDQVISFTLNFTLTVYYK